VSRGIHEIIFSLNEIVSPTHAASLPICPPERAQGREGNRTARTPPRSTQRPSHRISGPPAIARTPFRPTRRQIGPWDGWNKQPWRRRSLSRTLTTTVLPTWRLLSSLIIIIIYQVLYRSIDCILILHTTPRQPTRCICPSRVSFLLGKSRDFCAVRVHAWLYGCYSQQTVIVMTRISSSGSAGESQEGRRRAVGRYLLCRREGFIPRPKRRSFGNIHIQYAVVM
jgi:hypothetical protein